jgi:2-methylcitrate dehydratase PrpD
MDFVGRIKVELEPKFEGDGGRFRVACRLVVKTKAGQEHETIVLYRKGSPEDPMTGAELEEKFQTLTKSLGSQRSDLIAQSVERIDTSQSLAELAGLLTTNRSREAA